MKDTTDIPTIDQDFADWHFNQDPYPAMEEWRKAGPVVFDSRNSRYMVTSYRNCSKVLSDMEHFNSSGLVATFTEVFGGITMEALDSPRHHQMRGIWATDFERGNLESWRPVIEQVVASRMEPFVERLRAGESVDAITGMTRSIPTRVIAGMLGLESEMLQDFSDWSDAIANANEGRFDASEHGASLVAAGINATKALNEYIADAILTRRHKPPGDDLVSKMIFDDFAKTMEEEEIIASTTQLVFAGNETTAKLMASTLVALGRHPDQRRALAADRSRIPAAFEEVHRWATLVQTMPRFACSDDSQLADRTIPNGSEVVCMLGAANRDPERWDRPDQFDIFRQPRQHLGFGFGMHVCLGLNLARLEAQIWLNQLLDIVPDYELVEPIDFGRNFALRGPSAVPMVISHGILS